MVGSRPAPAPSGRPAVAVTPRLVVPTAGTPLSAMPAGRLGVITYLVPPLTILGAWPRHRYLHLADPGCRGGGRWLRPAPPTTPLCQDILTKDGVSSPYWSPCSCGSPEVPLAIPL